MRSALVVMLALMVVFSVAGLSSAEDKPATAGNKLEGGVKEAVTSPVRVPQEMVQTGKEQNPLIGVTLGSVRGAESTSRQATEGAIRTGFFYVPSEERPAIEEQGMGEKLAHGIQNTATGWTKIPVQLYQRGKENFLLLPVGVVEGSEQASLQTTDGALQTGFFFTGSDNTKTAHSQ